MERGNAHKCVVVVISTEIIDVDLQRDREKDFRSFSLGGFSFDAHSPAMAGK